MWLAGWVTLLHMVTMSQSAKILGVFPFPGTSHILWNLMISKELAQRGHEVTVYSPVSDNNALSNYTSHELQIKEEHLMQRLGYDIKKARKTNTILLLGMALTIGEHICEITMEDPAIKNLLESNEHYDVIILEQLFMDCIMIFAHKFKAPIVQISAYGGTSTMGDLFANPNPYSHVPHSFTSFSDKMDFWERLLNVLGETAYRMGMHFYYMPKQDAIIKKYYSHRTNTLPSVYELRTYVSLILLNSHFSIGYPRPLMPNMIEVGGMHIKSPQKLPKDIQEFLDSAKDGAIYFSMGSTLKSSSFPEEKKKIFLQVFSKLRQKILWKFEDASFPYKPRNLKLVKWLPQSDILAHPNVRAFITHGGLFSFQETVARGVPIIGIPMFADQAKNVEIAVRGGFGISLDYENITVSSFTWALNEVLHHQRYMQNAKRMSKVFLDRPVPPLELAMYWIEYVIRYNGTIHMRSAGVDLSWFQYFLLDVIGFFVFCFTTFLLILRYLPWMIKRTIAMQVTERGKKGN